MKKRLRKLAKEFVDFAEESGCTISEIRAAIYLR